MKKIRTLSLIAMVILAPYLIAYPYFALEFQLQMVFLNPGLWETHRWVSEGAVIATTTRAVYFLMWLVPTILGVGAILTALSIARLFYAGTIFADRVALKVMRLGQYTASSAFLTILAGCATPKVISWHNVDGPLDFRLWISVPNAGLVLCGLAFLLMGAVLREGIALAKENEAFV